MPFILKVRVLFKTRLIFPRINGPNETKNKTRKKNKQKQGQSRSLVFKEASVQGVKQVLIFLNRPGRIRRGFLRADRRRRS